MNDANQAPDNVDNPELIQTPDDNEDLLNDTVNNASPDDGTLPDIDEILGQYPDRYIRIHIENYNYVGGDNKGGVVGTGGSVVAEEIVGGDVIFQARDASDGSAADKIPTPQFSTTTHLENWFFEQEDLDVQLHFVLVAVFAGNTWTFVASFASRMIEDYRVNTEVPEQQHVLQPFRRKVTSMQKNIGAHLVESNHRNEAGLSPIQVVEFIHQDTQELALTLLRSSPDLQSLRQKTVSLLEKICLSPNTTLRDYGTPLFDLTRSQAAIGLGEFAKNDFDAYLNRVIRPWAKSSSVNLRFLVGWILFAIATDEDIRPNVVSLMKHWAKSGNWRLQWTAGAACSRIGLICLDDILDVIKSLLKSNSLNVFFSIYISLALLLASGTNTNKILHAFVDWLPSGNRRSKSDIRLTYNVLQVFFAIMYGRFENDASQTEQPFRPKNTKDFLNIWQLLHNNLCQAGTMQADFVVLLNEALNSSKAHFIDSACDAIEMGITHADAYETNRQTIVQTLMMMAKKSPSSRRYLDKIVNRTKFTSSNTANMLKKQM